MTILVIPMWIVYRAYKSYITPKYIDVEWEQLTHEESMRVYDKIIKGEIEFYEN